MSPKFGRELGETMVLTRERVHKPMTDVVARFRVGGSLDLRSASRDERRAVFDYFSEQGATIPPSQRLEFIEQGLLYRELDPNKIESVVPNLELHEKIQLALFLIDVVEDAQFNELFGFVMHALPHEAQREIWIDAQEKSRFARMLVAPFGPFEVTRAMHQAENSETREYPFEGVKNARRDVQEGKKVFIHGEKKVSTVVVSNFIDSDYTTSLLRDVENDYVHDMPALIEHLVTTHKRFQTETSLKLLQRIYNQTPGHLKVVFIPFASYLVTVDVISKDWMQNYISNGDWKWNDWPIKSQFLTADQKKYGANKHPTQIQTLIKQNVGEYLMQHPRQWLSQLREPEVALATMFSFENLVAYLDHLHADVPMIERLLIKYDKRFQSILDVPLECLTQLLKYAEQVGGDEGRTQILGRLQTMIRNNSTTNVASAKSVVQNFDRWEAVFGPAMDNFFTTIQQYLPAHFVYNLKLLEKKPGGHRDEWFEKTMRGGGFYHLVGQLEHLAHEFSVEPYDMARRMMMLRPESFFYLPSRVQAMISDDDGMVAVDGVLMGGRFAADTGDRIKKYVTSRRGVDGFIAVLLSYPKYLADFLTDEKSLGECSDAQLATILKKQPSIVGYVISRLYTFSHECIQRLFTLPLGDVTSAYQYIIHHHHDQLYELYRQSTVVGGVAREHTEFLWQFVRATLDTDRGLVHMLRGMNDVTQHKVQKFHPERKDSEADYKYEYTTHPSWPVAHYKEFKTLVNKRFVGLAEHDPGILFKKHIGLFSHKGFFDLPVEQRITELKREFSRYKTFGFDRDTELDDGETQTMLATSQLYQQHENIVSKGGVKDLERLAQKFRYIVAYNHDREIPEVLPTFAALEHLVDERVKKVAAKYFGFDEHALHGEVDMDVLMTMGTYVKTHEYDHVDLVNATRKFVPYLQHPKFNQWRAWGTFDELTVEVKHEQLQKLKRQHLIPEKLTLEQYEAWVRDEQSSLDAVFEGSIQDLQSTIKRTLDNAVGDAHVPEDEFADFIEHLEHQVKILGGKYTELKNTYKDFLKQYPREKEMPLEVHREFTQAREALRAFEHEHKEKLARIKARYYMNRLVQLTAHELESREVVVSGKSVTVSDMLGYARRVYAGTDFIADITNTEHHIETVRSEMFGETRVSRTVLSGTDRVDVNEHMHIGQKPCQSCQRPEGKLSTGLLSYVLDPQNRIPRVYAGGDLVAREIMRLIEDDEGNPVIFLEKPYSSNVHTAVSDMMVDMARKKARNMGIALLGDAESYNGSEQKVVRAIGSRTPYTYSDAGGGMCEKGKFETVGVVLN